MERLIKINDLFLVQFGKHVMSALYYTMHIMFVINL